MEVIGTAKHSSLLQSNIGPKSYEEDEMLSIRSRESFSQHFIFFVTYNAQYARLWQAFPAQYNVTL